LFEAGDAPKPEVKHSTVQAMVDKEYHDEHVWLFHTDPAEQATYKREKKVMDEDSDIQMALSRVCWNDYTKKRKANFELL